MYLLCKHRCRLIIHTFRQKHIALKSLGSPYLFRTMLGSFSLQNQKIEVITVGYQSTNLNP